MRLAILLAAVTALAQEPVLRGDLDRGFDDRFGFPSLDLWTTNVAATERGVYIGGSFEKVAKIDMRGMVRWDGRRFHAMNLGGNVSAIAVGLDEIFVGGSFNRAGDVAARNLARWSEVSSTWSAIGSGEGPINEDNEPGAIHALAVAGSHLYAAGDFESMDGVAAPGIARWDGGRWSSPVRGFDGTIFALAAMPDGKLIAGGEFSSITNNDGSQVQVRSLAVYDPNMDRWSSLGGGLGGDFFDAEVYAVAVDGPNVYVGGEFIEAGSATVSHIAMWNGSQWSSMGGGIDDDGSISSIVVANGMVYAAGGFESAGATDAYNIARWDGAEWHGLGGTDDYVESLAFWKGELYAVGSFEEAGDITVEYAARWSPETGNFRALGEGFTWLSLTGEVHAIAIDAAGNVYAGGNFTTVGGKSIPDLAMWDGSEWHPLGAGVNDLINDLLIVGDTLYVGGAFTEAGGIAAGGIAQWNMTTKTWSALGSGVNRAVFVLEPGPNGTIYVGGHFSAAGATDARNLAIWDPATSTWSKTPFDFPVAVLGGCYCVRALKADAGGVFVGGTFPHIEVNGTRIEAKSIYYWDRAANEVRTIGGGVTINLGDLDGTGTVHDIAIAPTGELYIAGHFDKVGGVGARHVARLTAAGWQALGAGLAHSYQYTDPAAIEFLGIGSQLIVAGQFTSAGEAQSPNVAIWDLGQNAWLPFGTGFVSDTTDEGVFAFGCRAGCDLFRRGVRGRRWRACCELHAVGS